MLTNGILKFNRIKQGSSVVHKIFVMARVKDSTPARAIYRADPGFLVRGFVSIKVWGSLC